MIRRWFGEETWGVAFQVERGSRCRDTKTRMSLAWFMDMKKASVRSGGLRQER